MSRSMTNTRDLFSRIARDLSRAMGQPRTFIIAILIIIAWAILGPVFRFSDTWQLVINTGTSVVTFLMVFLIQNTQNRDSDAIQVKLDELIRTSKAHNALLDLEELCQEDLDRIKKRYEGLADTLSGTAKNQAEIDLVTKLVRDITGVKDVQNRMSIQG